MDVQRLCYLFNQHSSLKITPEEEQELVFFLKEHDNDPKLKELIDEAWMLSQHEPANVFTSESSKRMLNRLMQEITPADALQQSNPLPQRTFNRWIWAAAVLVVAVAGTFFIKQNSISVKESPVVASPSPIAPGREGAILTLADGSQVVLDSLQDGAIASQNGYEIVLKEGALSYKGDATTESEMIFNTITTPNGRQFKLGLPDGTQVWLNAASSITYPVEFSAAQRAVKITGEAYFEVSTDKKRPFIVEKEVLSVVVTGTRFNINTYDDDLTAQVTLLEGRIMVKNGAAEKNLLPGQQAETTNTGQLQVHTSVNTEEVMAWKNGYFSFNNSDLQSVMRKLSRWYNVEVLYEGNIPAMKFGGEIARSSNLSQVLDILQESKVHFRIESNPTPGSSGKIIVSP
ncbi:MAG: FecR domain-containing protein [Chitinophagaceae bacterium]|nr:FecR domain-containing protein [Chitinophagaceae bacterium]MCW5929175.1 FecR domain-containing protein [Chitinophagaceae bacterium]